MTQKQFQQVINQRHWTSEAHYPVSEQQCVSQNQQTVNQMNWTSEEVSSKTQQQYRQSLNQHDLMAKNPNVVTQCQYVQRNQQAINVIRKPIIQQRYQMNEQNLIPIEVTHQQNQQRINPVHQTQGGASEMIMQVIKQLNRTTEAPSTVTQQNVLQVTNQLNQTTEASSIVTQQENVQQNQTDKNCIQQAWETMARELLRRKDVLSYLVSNLPSHSNSIPHNAATLRSRNSPQSQGIELSVEGTITTVQTPISSRNVDNQMHSVQSNSNVGGQLLLNSTSTASIESTQTKQVWWPPRKMIPKNVKFINRVDDPITIDCDDDEDNHVARKKAEMEIILIDDEMNVDEKNVKEKDLKLATPVSTYLRKLLNSTSESEPKLKFESDARPRYTYNVQDIEIDVDPEDQPFVSRRQMAVHGSKHTELAATSVPFSKLIEQANSNQTAYNQSHAASLVDVENNHGALDVNKTTSSKPPTAKTINYSEHPATKNNHSALTTALNSGSVFGPDRNANSLHSAHENNNDAAKIINYCVPSAAKNNLSTFTAASNNQNLLTHVRDINSLQNAAESNNTAAIITNCNEVFVDEIIHPFPAAEKSSSSLSAATSESEIDDMSSKSGIVLLEAFSIQPELESSLECSSELSDGSKPQSRETDHSAQDQLYTLSKKALFYCGINDCTFSTIMPVELEVHQLQAHIGSSSFVCVHCGFIAEKPAFLIDHLHSHVNEANELGQFDGHCNYNQCSFKPDTYKNLIYHIAQNHYTHTTHECFICKEEFDSSFKLISHMKRNILNVVKCPHCSAKDITKLNILKHITMNHPECGRLVNVFQYILCKERKKHNWPCPRKEKTASLGEPLYQSSLLSMSEQKQHQLEEELKCIGLHTQPNNIPAKKNQLKATEKVESHDQPEKESNLLEVKSLGNAENVSDKSNLQSHHSDLESSKEKLKKNSCGKRKLGSKGEGRKKRMMKCKECHLVTSNVGSMYRHVRHDHNITDMVICEICRIPLSVNKITDHHTEYHIDGDEDYIPTSLSESFETLWRLEKPVENGPPFKKRKKSSFKKKAVLERNIVEKIIGGDDGDFNDSCRCSDISIDASTDEGLFQTEVQDFSQLAASSVLLYKNVKNYVEIKDKLKEVLKDKKIEVKEVSDNANGSKVVKYADSVDFENCLPVAQTERESSSHDEQLEHDTNESQEHLLCVNENAVTSQETSVCPKEKETTSFKEKFISLKNTINPQDKRSVCHKTNSPKHKSIHLVGNKHLLVKLKKKDIKAPFPSGKESKSAQKKDKKIPKLSKHKSKSTEKKDIKISQCPKIKTKSTVKKKVSLHLPICVKTVKCAGLNKKDKNKSKSTKKKDIKMSQSPKIKSKSTVKKKVSLHLPICVETAKCAGLNKKDKHKSKLSVEKKVNSLAPVNEKTKHPEGFMEKDNNKKNIILQPPDYVKTEKYLGFKVEDCPDEQQFLHPDFEFRCKYCTFRRGTFKTFLHHIYYHFHYKKYGCSYCSFKGFSENRIITHVGQEHPEKVKNPNVKVKKDPKNEKRFLDLCHFCFVPKSKDDVELRERLAKKKLKLAAGAQMRKEQKKKVLVKKESVKKVKVQVIKKLKLTTIKKEKKLTKPLSAGCLKADGTCRYLCPYCRENRPLLSWIRLHIEICYHIHYKPLRCGYCNELETASMLRLTNHSMKEHPGKKVNCVTVLDDFKEGRLKDLVARSVKLSRRYNKVKYDQLLVKQKHWWLSDTPTSDKKSTNQLTSVSFTGNNDRIDPVMLKTLKVDLIRLKETSYPCVLQKEETSPVEMPSASSVTPDNHVVTPNIPLVTSDLFSVSLVHSPVTTDQPSVSTDQSSVSTDQPAVTTDQPAVTTDQPAVTTDQSSVTIDQSSVTTGQPSVTTDQSSVTADQPAVTTGQPSVTTDQSSVTTDQPAVTTGQPSVTTDQSSVSTDQPAVTTGQPSVTTDQPSVITDQPSVTTGQPSVTTDQPAVTTGQPSVITDQPSVTTGQPSVTTGQPAVTTGQPSVTTGQPSVTTGQPSVTTDHPAVTTDQPSVTTDQSSFTADPLFTTYNLSVNADLHSVTKEFISFTTNCSSITKDHPSYLSVTTDNPSDTSIQSFASILHSVAPDRFPVTSNQLSHTPDVPSISSDLHTVSPDHSSFASILHSVIPVHQTVAEGFPSVSSHFPSVTQDLHSLATDVNSDQSASPIHPLVSGDLSSITPDVPLVTPDLPLVTQDLHTITEKFQSVIPIHPSISADLPSVYPELPTITPHGHSVSADLPSIFPELPTITPHGHSVSADLPSISPELPTITPHGHSVFADLPSISPELPTITPHRHSVSADHQSHDSPIHDYRIYKTSQLFTTVKDSYGDPVFQCLKCEYTIRNMKSMYSHSYKHQPQIFHCEYCDYKAYPRSQTIWHLKTTHRGKPEKVIDIRQKVQDD